MAAARMKAEMEEQEKISSVFDRFDADKDGTINKDDFLRVLQRLDSDTWTPAAVEQLVAAMDIDQNGVIDLDEFLAWVYGDVSRLRDGDGGLVDAVSKLEEPAETKEAREPYTGPRWMLHHRGGESFPRTSLRIRPTDAKDFRQHSARNGEVVEVFAVEGKYAKIKLALSGASGWVKKHYLRECPEGTSFDRKTCKFGREEVPNHDGRIKEVRKFIRLRNVTRAGSDVRAEKVWFLTGHYLGETVQTLPKEVVFFGCRDSWADAIVESGFEGVWDHLSAELGAGAHFSPTSCGAFAKAESYFLICEVVLGHPDARLTYEIAHPELKYDDVVVSKGKLSVQGETGRHFDYPMRVVYDPMQCKPVYLVKLDGCGLYRFGGK